MNIRIQERACTLLSVMSNDPGCPGEDDDAQCQW